MAGLYFVFKRRSSTIVKSNRTLVLEWARVGDVGGKKCRWQTRRALQKVNTLKKQPLRLRFSVTKSLKFSLRHRNSVSQIDTEVDIGASKIQRQRTLKFSVPRAEIQSPSSLNKRLSPNKKQRPIGGW